MHIKVSVVQPLNNFKKESLVEMLFCPFVRTTIVVKTLKMQCGVPSWYPACMKSSVILYLMNSPSTEQHSPTSNFSYPLLWNVSQLLIKKTSRWMKPPWITSVCESKELARIAPTASRFLLHHEQKLGASNSLNSAFGKSLCRSSFSLDSSTPESWTSVFLAERRR